MKLISDVIAVQGSLPQGYDSVLLQQAAKGEDSALLSCVCRTLCSGRNGDMAAYIMGRLQDWYREKGLSLCGGEGKDARMEKALLQCLEYTGEELKYFAEKKTVSYEISLTGVLIWGSRFWLFHMGTTRAYLLNRCFGRAHMRQLTRDCRTGRGMVLQDRDEETEGVTGWDVGIQAGSLQSGVGILLCTEGFYGSVSRTLVSQCLDPGQISRERQISKRLGELAEEALREGCRDDISAVYIKC